MPLNIDCTKSFNELAQDLSKAFAAIKLNKPQLVLRELNQTIFNDINQAQDLLARVTYWLNVLWLLAEEGPELLYGAVYRMLAQIFAVMALQNHLSAEHQNWLRHLNTRYPSSDNQIQFDMDDYPAAAEIHFDVSEFEPSPLCQHQFDSLEQARVAQIHPQSHRFSGSLTLEDSRSLARSYSSDRGREALDSSFISDLTVSQPPSPERCSARWSMRSMRSVRSVYEEESIAAYTLHQQEQLLDAMDAEGKQLVEYQVEYFKGIYTALRANRWMVFGKGFLNHLKETDPYDKQLEIITAHIAVTPRLLGEPPSMVAWRKAEKLNLPISDDAIAHQTEKVQAYLVIYNCMYDYQNGYSNFAAKLTGLSYLAKCAAIEHHVSSKPNSRSARAWQLAEKGLNEGYSFAVESNGQGKPQLPVQTCEWLLTELNPAPSSAHRQAMLGVTPNAATPFPPISHIRRSQAQLERQN